MKCFAVLCAVCALCAIAFADDAPDVLLPCAFRMTAHAVVKSVDGEELATSINEIIHDNGDNWVWKSEFSGNEFIQAFLPDHEWAIIWREDLGKSFRHDLKTQKCVVATDIPTPYKWIESKTYGIVWFDEPVMYDDKEATLFTAVAAGSRAGVDFEAVAAFYVRNSDRSIVHFNGTVTAAHKEFDIIIESTSLSFEHNKAIDPKFFVVSAPCEAHEAPKDPSDDFKKKCYKQSGSSASIASMSWLALIVAILAALLNF